MKHGNFSGEWFRDVVLIPKIRELKATGKEDWSVTIDLTGSYGIPASWLDEVTWSLSTKVGRDVQQHLHFITEDDRVIEFQPINGETNETTMEESVRKEESSD